MKAWLVYDTNDMRLEDVPIPKVKPGWILSRVKTFQPSITEVQRFTGASSRGLDKMRKLIKDSGPFPFGHEISAEVVDAPADYGFKVGDRVTYFHYPGHIAGSDYPGAFAEYFLIPLYSACKLNTAIPDVQVPALQPLSSCMALVQEAKVGLHDTVVVFGQGVMGSSVTQLCHMAGARQVIGVDVRDQCLQITGKLGADVTINATREDPVEAIMKLTNGKGAQVAFECASGSPEVGLSGGKTLHQAIKVLARHGRLIQVAFYSEPVSLDPNLLRSSQIKYIFPDEAPMADIQLAAELVESGRIQIKQAITHVLHGLDKLPEAFDITANKAAHGAINPPVVVLSS